VHERIGERSPGDRLSIGMRIRAMERFKRSEEPGAPRARPSIDGLAALGIRAIIVEKRVAPALQQR
jgi:hypothetical protein